MNPDLNLRQHEVLEDATHTVEMVSAVVGTIIGSYRLVRQLGEGGMGVVYHAQQREPIRRDVALKIIKPGMDSKQVIARFETERQALAIMDHGNIARVFDGGTTGGGLPYFVMELVDGIPITRYCDSKRLTINERIALFIPVCQAIQHAHQKGIIHRDIKPSNILVAEQDGKAVPKVIDFGLAKAWGRKLSDETDLMTSFGTVMGTVQYMSPEQAEMSRQDIDTRSDIYSLGVVLYELMTGTTPLDREHLTKAAYTEVLRTIREEEPASPSARIRRSNSSSEIATQRRTNPADLPKLLHGELDWITMKTLEKDRQRRYETVNGLARDLERYLDGEPVEAAPPSTTYRLGKFVRKHGVWLGIAAAFTLLLVAGVVVSSYLALRASRAEAEARAVNAFLQDDLLAQASASNQAGPNTKPDRNLTVRAVLDRAAAKIEGTFGTQPLVEASIRRTIGRTYLGLGFPTEAERQLERALELRRRLLGEQHPDTLASMSDLATAYDIKGKAKQAATLLATALPIQRRMLGAEHRDTLSSMSVLAAIFFNDRKYAESELLYAQLLEMGRRVLGKEHPDTLSAMNGLASIYFEQRKYAKSEELFSQLLDAKRLAFGQDHPSVQLTLANLAAAYQVQGKYAQAEQVYLEALEIQRRVLGDEHPSTLTTTSNLGELYRDEGKYAESEPLLIKALEARRRKLGEDHPNSLYTMNVLAELYVREGKYSQAEALYAKALESVRRALGKEDPMTLDTLAALGNVQLLRQKYLEAETLLREALRGNERIRPEEWQRFNTQSLLGASLAGQKKYAEAEPPQLAGYRGLIEREPTMWASDRARLGPEAGERIVELYQRWGKPDKAAEWRQRLRERAPRNSTKQP